MSGFELVWLHLQWLTLVGIALVAVVFVRNLLVQIVIPGLLTLLSRMRSSRPRPCSRSLSPRFLEMPGRTPVTGKFLQGAFRS